MPTISCPDCGRECSTEAVVCPNCGRPCKKADVETASPVVNVLFYGSLSAFVITMVVFGVWWFGGFDGWRQSADANNNTAQHAIPSEQQIRQEQVLFSAAYKNDYATVYKLALQGVDVNTTRPGSGSCPSPLFAAVLGGSTGLKQQVDFSRRDSRLDVVKTLLDEGADVNATNSGKATVLMFARADGDTPLVDVLLKAGANPDARDASGNTAYDYANFDELKRRAALDVNKYFCIDAIKNNAKANLKKLIEQQVEQEK